MADARLSIDEVLLKLKDVKPKPGGGWLAKCPSHEDHVASLSIDVGREDRILFKCFAHCSFQNIREALGLSIGDLMPPRDKPAPFPRPAAVYQYRDLDGQLRYEVVRYNEPKKTFRQRQPKPGGGYLWHLKGVRKLPYRLPELKGHLTIYITEGEKDVDTLWRLGLPATTNSGGGGKQKWGAAETEAIAALGVLRVIIIPDNDETGRVHAEDVAGQMKACGIAWTIVKLPDLPPHGDVSDWIAAGHSRVELEALIATTPWIVRGTLDDTPAPSPDPHGASQWELTEMGAAEGLTARLSNRLRFDHRHDRWLIWNHHHWRPDNVRAVEQLALQHFRQWRKEAVDIRDTNVGDAVGKYARQCENRGRFENVLKSARPMPGISSSGHEWDQNDFLLGCPNGVVDLRTGTLRDGNPDDHITLQTGVAFDPLATAPVWERFLIDIFDGAHDVFQFTQRALGFSLTGKMEPAVFFMCVGHGSNGKSTFLNAVNHVWGRYAYTTSMSTFTVSATGADNDFNLAELDGPRLIIASEAKVGSSFNEQLLKNYTGGEKVNAQRKHGRPFEFQPKGKIWMGLNHQPAVKDDSHGFWRRMQVITFPRTFDGSSVDLTLADKLKHEAPGILAWAVRGCLLWQENGLEPPLSVRLKVEEYKDEEDPNREFLMEYLDLTDGDAEENMQELYDAFLGFCTKTGRRFVPSKKSLGKYLSRKFEKRESNGKVIYRGLRIKFRPQGRMY